MKKLSRVLVVLALAVLLFPPGATVAHTKDDPLSVDLLVAGSRDVGDVNVWNDPENLYVTYLSSPGTCFQETHLVVVTDLADMPRASWGTEREDSFAYADPHGCVREYTYTIRLSENGWTDGTLLYVAAQAATLTGDLVEDAWGDGSPIAGNAHEAYFTYALRCPPKTPAIDIRKQAEGPDSRQVEAGSDVTFDIVVTNTGEVTLQNVTVSDPQLPACDRAIGTLTPGQQVSYPCAVQNLDADLYNVACVTGDPPSGDEVTDCDPSDVDVIVLECIDFPKFVEVGESVEGEGKVHDLLSIDAQGTAVRIAQEQPPVMYGSPNVGCRDIGNGRMELGGGFSDAETGAAGQAHRYTFSFASEVKEFRLRMLDFGDYNPSRSTAHYASMIAYDVAGTEVHRHELAYQSDGWASPRDSTPYGNLTCGSGDAMDAAEGQPGNWIWHVEGEGITRVLLDFGDGFDPYIGFDSLSFTTASETVHVDLRDFAPGESIEGEGTVHDLLNIDAQGTAVKIAEERLPRAYAAGNLSCPDRTSIDNGELEPGSGFSDTQARDLLEPHRYTFTLVSGVTVREFKVRMQDFGDFNPTMSKNHYASMIAYDVAGTEVSRHELAYQSNGLIAPTYSPQYGNLKCGTGDATDAAAGQPGDWTWHVEGAGIARVELVFEDGFDPYVGFHTLCIDPERPTGEVHVD